jgi:acetyl-CoA carboxylase carboxyltransferase component
VTQSHSLYCQLQSEKIPLVFVQDVTGFMVGSKSEQGGIIKDGANG